MMVSSKYPMQVGYVRAFPDRKYMRLGAVLLFASTMISGCGGSSNPLQYKRLHPGTSLQEFEANCPDAKKGEPEKDNDGNSFEVYRLIRPADNTREKYYFQDDRMTGILVIFGANRNFDEVVDELKKANGESIGRVNIAGGSSVSWEHSNTKMNLFSAGGNPGSPMPNEADTVKAGEFILQIGGDLRRQPNPKANDSIDLNAVRSCNEPTDCVIVAGVCMYSAINKNYQTQFMDWAKKQKELTKCEDQFVPGAQADCREHICTTVYSMK